MLASFYQILCKFFLNITKYAIYIIGVGCEFFCFRKYVLQITLMSMRTNLKKNIRMLPPITSLFGQKNSMFSICLFSFKKSSKNISL